MQAGAGGRRAQALACVIAALSADSRQINSNQEIAQVGMISANGDAGIGQMIA